MKQFFPFAAAMLLFASCSKNLVEQATSSESSTQATQVGIQAITTETVTVFRNGYVYPFEQSNGYGTIGTNGLGAWINPAGYTRVFFYPTGTGTIDVSIKVKAPAAGATLKIRLDSAGTTYNVVVNQTSSYVTLPVGTFTIASAQYHCLEIKAAAGNGSYLPDVESIMITSSLGLKYNKSVYRGAPATHLSYPVPADSSIEYYYSEMTVPTGADPLYSYYMSNGFSGGYFGIQVNSNTERRALFSIWSNYNTDDPNQIPADYAVTLVRKGTGVTHGNFGNEGSGGQSYYNAMWVTNNTYKFLVRAVAAGTHTKYTGWFYAPEAGNWKLIAEWDKAMTQGKLLSGLYSFVENYASNGNDFFKARYGNQWVRTVNGTWIELNKANFTTTASDAAHQRYDLGAGIENNVFHMYSGGFRLVGGLTYGQQITRPTTGTPPSINFTTLP
ncbi:uncharacterized protein DUF5077 [Chitinophaga skermanii]|uniref:Uncharacterized protein DUF5077 n=1 Tax=Chitinophaga skermanii TaxID=331697 RepID=A0A327QQV8_9BACT|nr:DUF3472 domain-containing protein [Chitinophaga skermanii]RAJ06986.1 uncharacterized protein DUF5077 [Chitinophaga skermanii]